jgi:hypothetical protein
MVEWIAPVKVLANWVSFDWDTLSRGSWFEFLRGIRDDGQYSDVKTSVERFGFRKPLIYAISDEGVYIHGDGHHRFAAALDLGYEVIPYLRVPWGLLQKSVEPDSWYFSSDNYAAFTQKNPDILIHESNPLPMCAGGKINV